MVKTDLLFIGVVVVIPALYMLYTGLSLARRSDARAGTLSSFIALVNSVIGVSLLVVDTFVRTLSPFFPLVAFASGLVLLVFGAVVFLLVERSRPAFRPEYSYGLLAIGTGALLMVAALFIPILPAQFAPPGQEPILQEPILAAASATSTAGTPTLIPPTLAPSPTRTFTPPPTPTVATLSPTPPPTATPTRAHYSTRTPVPSATVGVACSALVNYNLNLRAAPNTDSAILAVIPFGSTVAVAGRSEDGGWWVVDYNGRWGWVSGEYITIESRCQDAPVVE